MVTPILVAPPKSSIKLIFMTVKIFFQKEVSEGVDDRQVNALKYSGKNAGVSENKTEE